MSSNKEIRIISVEQFRERVYGSSQSCRGLYYLDPYKKIFSNATFNSYNIFNCVMDPCKRLFYIIINNLFTPFWFPA